MIKVHGTSFTLPLSGPFPDAIATPEAWPGPEALPLPAADPEPLLNDLVYSLVTPLQPLVCELIALLNGLLGLVRSLVFDFLLNYILGDLVNGGEVPLDSIFNLLPLL